MDGAIFRTYLEVWDLDLESLSLLWDGARTRVCVEAGNLKMSKFTGMSGVLRSAPKWL